MLSRRPSKKSCARASGGNARWSGRRLASVRRDAHGNTPIMRSIKEAESQLWNTESTKTYTAMTGDSGFHNAMADLVLADSVDQDRVSFCATPGGTGAIHHVLELAELAV